MPCADLQCQWALVSYHSGLVGIRWHDLHHTFATCGAGGGLGLPIPSKLLGHASPETYPHYAQLDTGPVGRAAELIGDGDGRCRILQGRDRRRPTGELVGSVPVARSTRTKPQLSPASF